MKNALKLLAIMLIASGCADKPDTEGMQDQCGNIYCHQGESCCDGHCINKATDNRNCGACGNYCGKYGTCSDSKCQCTTGGGVVICGAGQACCSSGCTNIQQNMDNCGECDIACPKVASTEGHYSVPANPSEKCSQGVCKLNCEDGFVDADKSFENGCECLKGSACDTTQTQPATNCTNGTYQCDNMALQFCQGGIWSTIKTCQTPQKCDASQRDCVASSTTPVTNANSTDFEWLDATTTSANPKYITVGNTKIKVAASVVEGTQAINGSGKSVKLGPTQQAARIDVTGIVGGIGNLSFKYRLDTGTPATLRLMTAQVEGGLTSSDDRLANGDNTEIVFSKNDSTITIFYLFAVEGTIIIDDLSWTPAQ